MPGGGPLVRENRAAGWAGSGTAYLQLFPRHEAEMALISALIHAPKLIIMDEPFVGLDPKASHALKN